MRALPAAFAEYRWAPSTEVIAAGIGLDPSAIKRFDGNVPAVPSPVARPEAVAAALAQVNEYVHGGFPALVDAIAQYVGAGPENVGLAGARVGYALADMDTAAELNRRQAPQPISGISAALALAALAEYPDVSEQVAERERCAAALGELGLEPLPSQANFLFLPAEEPHELGAALLREGLVVRVFPDGIRFSIRDREDDDRLLEALAELS